MKRKNGFGFNLIWAVVVSGIAVSLIGALSNLAHASTGNIHINTTQVQANGTTLTGPGNLVIQNGGDLTAAAGDRFTINMGGDVIIHAGGRITGNVHIIAANVIIYPATATLPAGTINVTGRGYAGGSGPGRGMCSHSSSSMGGGGAGYGGRGGDRSFARGGQPYGSILKPTDLGSGGGGGGPGGAGVAGGAGGGKIRLDVSGILTVNGTIVAGGGVGGEHPRGSGGGGSGGSIWITAGTLAGTGAIRADGGRGGTTLPRGAGGAGGRIAIYYTNSIFTGTITASGGGGGIDVGGPGTIVFNPIRISPVSTPTSATTQTITGTVRDGFTVTMLSTTPGTTFGAITYNTAPSPDTWGVVATLVEGPNNITATTSPDEAGNTAVANTTIVHEFMFAGGDGSAANPFQIADWHHLNAVRGHLTFHFVLMNNLDFTTAGYMDWVSPTMPPVPPTGAGWEPIGTFAAQFTGNFNGQGREIRDLFINRPTTNNVGLFGVVGSGGFVRNVGVINANVTGRNVVGSLAGGNSGTITNSSSSGNVSGPRDVGGLVGANSGTVSNSSNSGSVTATSLTAGGLVGWNSGGTVTNSFASGSVSSPDVGGGLVGWNEGTVTNSFATGSVTGTTRLGGLVGGSIAGATVTNSFWNTETSGRTWSDGGTGMTTAEMKTLATFTHPALTPSWDIVAVALGAHDTTRTWNIVDGVTYPVLSWKTTFAGGHGIAASPYLITDWRQLNEVRNHLSSHFILMNNLDAGTAGYTELASSTANAGAGWEPIGGTWVVPFTGNFNGQGFEVRDLFINRPAGWSVGLFGFVGTEGAVKNVGVVNASVTSAGSVGGVVGNNRGTISNSYFAGNVSGGDWVGGIVSHNAGTGTISNSYSTGSVTGRDFVGGLVGNNDGTITNSYVTGSVGGTSNVGGLAGRNRYTVTNSYSTGSVTGTGDRVGGLLGWNYATVTNSFWNIETSGQAASAGGTGVTTAQMRDIAIFTYPAITPAWDIVAVAPGARDTAHIWNIVNGETFPFLSWHQGYSLTMVVAPTGGGVATDLIGALSYPSGTVVNIKAAANPGFSFAGWSAPAGTFGDATTPTTTFTMPAQNVTVTAQWTVNQYTITFDAAGGSAVAPITQGFGTAVTAPANPTRVGHTFAGWSPEVPATIPAENITLTAQWEATTEIQNEPDFSVKLGPNPISESLVITISDAGDYVGRVVRLSVYDSRGRAFRREEIVINGVYDEVEVDVSQLPAGVCFVVLEVEGFDAKKVTFAKVDDN